MRIALVTMEFQGDPGHGGIGIHVYHLALGLKELGHDVHVVTNSQSRDDYTSEEGIHIHRARIAELDRQSLRSHLPYLGFALARILPLWRRMIELAGQYKFDVIDVQDHLAAGLFNARTRSLPMIVRLQTPFFLLKDLGTNDVSDSLDAWIVGTLEKYCLQQSDALVGISKATAALISERCPLPQQRIVFLSNPIACSTLPQKTDYAQGSENFTIVCPGRLEKRKGSQILLRALRIALGEVRDLRIKFIGADTEYGDSTMMNVLRQFLVQNNMQKHVEFVGPVPNQEMWHHMREADAVVLPSLFDNAPLACLESMAIGTPVIGTDAGGMPESLGNGTRGIVVKAGDAEDLARAIVSVATDQSLRRTLADEARKYVHSDCSHLKIASESVLLYEQVIKARQVGVAATSIVETTVAHDLRVALDETESILDLLEVKGSEIQQSLEATWHEGFIAGSKNARNSMKLKLKDAMSLKPSSIVSLLGHLNKRT